MATPSSVSGMGFRRAREDLPYLCEEVSGLLVPDKRVVNEHLQEAESTVDMMLARLDEMNTMLETMDATSNVERARVEPVLKEFCKRLDEDLIFVDRTAESVLNMKTAVEHMEAELSNAEAAQARFNRKATLNSLTKTVTTPSLWSIGWRKSSTGTDADVGTSEEDAKAKMALKYKNENLAMNEAMISAVWQAAKSAASLSRVSSVAANAKATSQQAPAAPPPLGGQGGQAGGEEAGEVKGSVGPVAGQVCEGEEEEEEEEEQEDDDARAKAEAQPPDAGLVYV
eukprot:1153264-Prorocentrum_minimum.AAC.2